MNAPTDTSILRFIKDYAVDDKGPALVYYNNRITYQKLFKEIDRIAGYLVSAGIGKGDSICICLPNIPQAIVTLYAANKAGAVANMVHPMVNSLGLRRKIQTTASKMVFLAENLYHRYADDLEGMDIVEVVCSPADYLPPLLKAGYSLKRQNSQFYPYLEKRIPFDFKLLRGREDAEYPEVNGGDIAAYMHSGGTTGEPKTIMLSNKNINQLGYGLIGSMGNILNKEAALYAVLPMFHGYGLAICFNIALATRTKIVLIPQFKPEEAAKIIKRQKISMLIGVPQIYQKLVEAKSFRGSALKSLEYCFCGGESISDKTAADFQEILRAGGSRGELLEGYGLTEAVTVCTVNRKDAKKAGSVGKPIEGVSISIIDKDKNPLPAGEQGEICVSGEVVMAGYLNDPEATAEAIFTDGGGRRWVKSGDIGYLDNEGYLYFVSRLKRIIIVSGMNVYPAEIERYAAEIEGVSQSCAVEKITDGKKYIALYVVMKKGVKYVPEFVTEAFKHLNRNLDKWSQPSVIIPVDKLPLTGLGKIDVNALSKRKD